MVLKLLFRKRKDFRRRVKMWIRRNSLWALAYGMADDGWVIKLIFASRGQIRRVEYQRRA